MGHGFLSQSCDKYLCSLCKDEVLSDGYSMLHANYHLQ